MRKIILFALLLSTLFCNAQNYNCLKADTTSYFTNSIGYLRRITIDSVKTAGTDTTYYPFKTYRLFTLPDGMNGSWLGSRITKKEDGTFLFFTAWNDTVFIRTRADSGDSWTFFNDTSSKWYKATVTNVDTMTLSGMTDSVKRIKITPYSAGVVDGTDLIGHFEIIISKNHGFVKAFELYLFPFRDPRTNMFDTRIDPYLHEYAGEHSSLSSVPRFLFSPVSYNIPTKHEIYDFAVGDVFVNEHRWEGVGHDETTIIFDSIITKTTVSPSSTLYDTYRKSIRIVEPYGGPTLYYSSESTSEILADTSTLNFNVPRLPEDISDQLIACYYKPVDSSHCTHTRYYKVKNIVLFEGCDESDEYLAGFKQLYSRHDNGFPTHGGGCYASTNRLIFSIKNGVPCGSNISWNLAVKAIESRKVFNLYPNPADHQLTVEAAEKIHSLSVINLMGQIVLNKINNSRTAELDVASLPPGLYFLKVNNSEIRKFLKQ